MNMSNHNVLISHLVLLIFVFNRNLSTANAQFLRTPENKTVVLGHTAQFFCKHQTADSVIWKINETTLTSFEGITEDRKNDGGRTLYILEVEGIAEYNTTSIMCEAFFVSGQPNDRAEAVLLIQGVLSAPYNLTRDSVTNITWNGPFSLSLTNINPDIIYSVEVYDITCVQQEFLFSVSNVTSSYYNTELLQNGRVYKIIVTPRSNGGISVNGTSVVLNEIFFGFQKPVVDMNSSYLKLTFQRTNVGNVQPAEYILSCVPVDGVDDITLIRSSTIIEQTTSTLRLGIVQLQEKRVWECSLQPHKCSPLISPPAVLSTHKLQNITISSPGPCKMNLTGNWIGGKASNRVLVIAYSKSPNSTYYFIVEKRSGLDSKICLPGDEYNVSVFPFGENGRPFERAATTPLPLTIAANPVQSGTCNEQQSSTSFTYNRERLQNRIKITCNFDDKDLSTTCMVVIHKRITMLDSNGLNRIKESRILKRHGDSASGFFNMTPDQKKKYVLNVFQVDRDPKKSDGNTQTNYTSVVIVMIFLMLATVIIVSVIMLITRKLSVKKTGQVRIMTRMKTKLNDYEDLDDLDSKDDKVFVDKEKALHVDLDHTNEDYKLLDVTAESAENTSQSTCTFTEAPDNPPNVSKPESFEMVGKVDQDDTDPSVPEETMTDPSPSKVDSQVDAQMKTHFPSNRDDTLCVTEDDGVLTDKPPPTPETFNRMKPPPFMPEGAQQNQQPQDRMDPFPVQALIESEIYASQVKMSEKGQSDSTIASQDGSTSSSDYERARGAPGPIKLSGVEESSTLTDGVCVYSGINGAENGILMAENVTCSSFTVSAAKDLPVVADDNNDAKEFESTRTHEDTNSEKLSQLEDIPGSNEVSKHTSGQFVIEDKNMPAVRTQRHSHVGRQIKDDQVIKDTEVSSAPHSDDLSPSSEYKCFSVFTECKENI